MELYDAHHASELAQAFDDIDSVYPFVDKLVYINSNWKIDESRTTPDNVEVEYPKWACKMDFPNVNQRLVVETDGETVQVYFEGMEGK